MTPRRIERDRRPRLSTELRERGSVRPLELFFDLVFVLAFTQCTALMAADPTWTGIGRGMLVLAMVWWAWVGYAWLTSVVEPEEGLVRIAMFVVMAALLVVALSIPDAFGDRALGFAIAYGVVRLGHIALFLLASRHNPDLRRSILGLAIGTVVAIGLLVAASFVGGGAQIGLWLLAILIDWGEPAIFGVEHWRLIPAHFAERHNLIIILALGESVVALGVGADVDFTTRVLVAAVFGIGLASALWWIYFDVVAAVTERRLTRAAEGRERNSLARDSYSYLHFPMAAGIVLGALGLEAVLAHTDIPLDTVHAFALLGGTAIYLLAHVALRLRNAGSINVERLVRRRRVDSTHHGRGPRRRHLFDHRGERAPLGDDRLRNDLRVRRAPLSTAPRHGDRDPRQRLEARQCCRQYAPEALRARSTRLRRRPKYAGQQAPNPCLQRG